MFISWLVLIIAGVLEVLWASFLKRAEGFRYKGWVSLGLAVELISVIMLAWAMKRITLGVGYAAWVGIGTVGAVIVGLVAFAEPLTVARASFLALLIGGIVGLQLVA